MHLEAYKKMRIHPLMLDKMRALRMLLCGGRTKIEGLQSEEILPIIDGAINTIKQAAMKVYGNECYGDSANNEGA